MTGPTPEQYRDILAVDRDRGVPPALLRAAARMMVRNGLIPQEWADEVLRQTPGERRANANQTPVAARPAPRTLPCVHLGAEARQQQCATCGGRVMVRVFACGLFTETTLVKPLPNVACCASCPKYEPRP